MSVSRRWGRAFEQEEREEREAASHGWNTRIRSSCGHPPLIRLLTLIFQHGIHGDTRRYTEMHGDVTLQAGRTALCAVGGELRSRTQAPGGSCCARVLDLSSPLRRRPARPASRPARVLLLVIPRSPCVSVLAPPSVFVPYSFFNPTIGSTVVARRAGT